MRPVPLRAKLFVGLAALVVVALASVYLVVTSFLVTEVEGFLVTESRGAASGLVADLARRFAERRAWGDVASVFAQHEQTMQGQCARMDPDCPMRRFQWGDLALLADVDGRVVYASSPDLPEGRLLPRLLARGLPVQVEGETIGLLFTGAMLGRWSGLERSLLSSVRRSVALSLGISVLFIGVISLVLLRALTRPFLRLVEATRRIASGDLSVPVPREGKDEVGELSRVLDDLRLGLARAEEARHRLLADIAHELRNPLAVLRAKVEAMLDGLQMTDAEALASLDDRLLHLSSLVNELQDVALAESGELHLDEEILDLAVLLRDVAADAEALVARGGKSFRLDLSPSLPFVRADRRRLLQVLWNLLINADRHTQAGDEVALAAGAYGEKVEVRVSDTGEGMDEETRAHLFDRFQHGKGKGGGLGLGLAITRELVRAHGGALSVESDVGRGTTVSFTLLRGDASGRGNAHLLPTG